VVVVVGSPKPVDLSRAEEIIDRYMDENPNEAPEEAIVPLFLEFQETYGYVPQAAADLMGERLGLFLTPIFGTLSFYTDFRLTPPGQKIIFVCDGAACHLRRSQPLLEVLKRRLGLEPGQTTSDGRITLQTTNCLGACDLAPLVDIEGVYHGNVTAADMERLIDGLVSPVAAAGS
jgi:NADH-quinone oxidoreductase subunit E